MGQLRLLRATRNGKYYTLTGIGLTIELIHEAIKKVNADPNDVVMRFRDGERARLDVMYPTPHTFLFDSLTIKDSKLCFWLGNRNLLDKHELSLADPNLSTTLAAVIHKRAKQHRKTKIALNHS